MQGADGTPRRSWSARAGGVLLVAVAATLPWQGVRLLTADGLLQVNQGVDKADGLLVSDLLLLAAAALGGVALLRRRGLTFRPDRRVLVGLGLFLLAGFVAMPFEANGDSTQLFLRWILVALLCLAAVWGVDPPARTVRAVGVALVAGACASVAFGALGVFAHGEGPARFQSGTGRAVGLAANAGSFALLTTIALAVALVAGLEAGGPRARRCWYVAAAVLGVGMLVSGSRGATAAALVVLGVVVWRALRTGRRRAAVGLLLATVVGLGVGVLGLVTVPVVDRALVREGEVGATADRSADVRFDQLGAEVERRGASSLLLGSGLRDEEPTEADLAEGRLLDPHTSHLEVWLGLGLLGLAGWVLVWVAAIVPGAAELRRRDPLRGTSRQLAAASLASFAFVVGAFTANNVWGRHAWLLVAVAALLDGRRRSEGAGTEARTPATSGEPR